MKPSRNKNFSFKDHSIKEHEVDTLGAFPPSEPTDYELDLIDNLLADLQSSLHKLVILKREARASNSSDSDSKTIKKQATLWPSFVCRAHGDGVPFGKAFDRLIIRIEDSKK